MKTISSAFALALCAGFATAGLTPESASFGSSLRVDYSTGATTGGFDTRMTAVYDNLSAPAAANAAFSSTDLNSTWGDTLGTLGTGTLQEFGFTVFNSGSSGGGALLTAGFEILFFRAGDSSFIGGFTTNVNFGAGLGTGFFSTITVTGLDALNINLDTTNLIVTQRRTASTGTANRLGFASLNPLLAGTTSPSTFYASSTTVGGGVAGFYNLNPAGTQTNLGYRVVVPTPATAGLLAVGGLFAARRRR